LYTSKLPDGQPSCGDVVYKNQCGRVINMHYIKLTKNELNIKSIFFLYMLS